MSEHPFPPTLFHFPCSGWSLESTDGKQPSGPNNTSVKGYVTTVLVWPPTPMTGLFSGLVNNPAARGPFLSPGGATEIDHVTSKDARTRLGVLGLTVVPPSARRPDRKERDYLGNK